MDDVGFEQLHGSMAGGLKTVRQRLRFGGPVVEVAFVQRVLQLLGSSSSHHSGRGQVVLGTKLAALGITELAPVSVLLQQCLLLPKRLPKGVQLGVERLAQQVYGFIKQRAHGVWVGQQAALHFDGIGLSLQ